MTCSGTSNTLPSTKHRLSTFGTALLKANRSNVTFEEIRQAIFQSDLEDFNSYVRAMLALLSLDQRDISLSKVDDTTLLVIRDAWNFFPHRPLGNRCPAEIMVEHLPRPNTDRNRQHQK